MTTRTARAARAAAAKTAALWALRLALGGLFVVTGALKVGDPAAFAVEIHNYQLFPALAPVLAAALPGVELAAGLAILAGPRAWVRAGALACAALMLVFTVAVGSVVARGINISCGCFGAGSGPVTWLTILRDVALLVASAALLHLAVDAPPQSPSGGHPGAPDPARVAA
jgi:putative oxidoreductase